MKAYPGVSPKGEGRETREDSSIEYISIDELLCRRNRFARHTCIVRTVP